MPSVHHRGADLWYEDLGSGPPLIFQHGYLSTGAIWDDVVTPLAEDFRCIRLDARGVGASSRPTGGYGIDETIDDVLAIADHAGIDTFTYVGHSLGGTLGYVGALRAPDRFGRLVLVCPGPASPPRAGRALFAPFRAAWEAGDAAELSRLLAFPYAVKPRQEVLDARGVAAAAVAAGHVDDLLASAEPLDIREELPNVSAPVLVVAADRDGPFRASVADFLRLPADSSSLHVFSGIGHVPQQECPDDLVAVLRRNLRR